MKATGLAKSSIVLFLLFLLCARQQAIDMIQVYIACFSPISPVFLLFRFPCFPFIPELLNMYSTFLILLSLSPSAPYLSTLHLSLHRIGCKRVPSCFAFPIINYCCPSTRKSSAGMCRINSWLSRAKLTTHKYCFWELLISFPNLEHNFQWMM